MTTTVRVPVWAVVVTALLFLTTVNIVRAADPTSGGVGVGPVDTLGAQVSSTIFADEDPRIQVLNLGTVPMEFTFEPPSNWSVSPSTLTLDPGARGSVTMAGSGESGLVVITGTQAGGIVGAGQDRARIQFSSSVQTSRPYQPPWGLFAASFLAGLALMLVVRRLRPWEFRVGRVADREDRLHPAVEAMLDERRLRS